MRGALASSVTEGAFFFHERSSRRQWPSGEPESTSRSVAEAIMTLRAKTGASGEAAITARRYIALMRTRRSRATQFAGLTRAIVAAPLPQRGKSTARPFRLPICCCLARRLAVNGCQWLQVNLLDLARAADMGKCARNFSARGTKTRAITGSECPTGQAPLVGRAASCKPTRPAAKQEPHERPS